MYKARQSGVKKRSFKYARIFLLKFYNDEAKLNLTKIKNSTV